MDLASLRNDYMRASLDVADVDPDPFRQFARWFDDAYASKVPEVNAMTLATADADGRPSARIVLLKGVDARGFVFYTNLRSRKGREIEARPRAALLFFWPELERQVRIEGSVERTSAAESDEYYRARPLPSRIGAWASPQSEPISSAGLALRVAEAALRHGLSPERPPHWGGFRLVPDALELWQGRPSRLHDRVAYRLGSGGWTVGRLAP